MLRDIDLNEISDGRLYTANDMVKADCMGCQGCASCCQGMGDSIVLDPYDMYRLCMGLKNHACGSSCFFSGTWCRRRTNPASP